MPKDLKPVKLQVNTSGAWKDVVRFDAADPVASDKVMQAAPLLGDVSGATFRIAMCDSYQTVLMSWTPDKGWKTWREHP